jgi:hypothetical protein
MAADTRLLVEQPLAEAEARPEERHEERHERLQHHPERHTLTPPTRP